MAKMDVTAASHNRPGLIVADTVTTLGASARGSVLVCSSHGGRYAAFLAADAGAGAVILNDAGIGLDRAGIGGLDLCEEIGLAAAAVSHASCRIGDAADMMRRGIVSAVNGPARRCGVAPGMPCAEAAERLRAAPTPTKRPDKPREARRTVDLPGAARRIVLVDSASLVGPEDEGQVVVTGSHGGLVGGNPEKALKVAAFAAVFNDAGVGADNAGTSRLPVLEARGMAAFTVAAASARIGEASSSFADGVVSAANGPARALGVAVGARAEDVITRLCFVQIQQDASTNQQAGEPTRE